MTIGEKIKNARKAAGLTQRELGERLELSYQAVAQWENNLRKPKRETLYRIATALNISPVDLDESLRINLAMDFFEKIMTESSSRGQEKISDDEFDNCLKQIGAIEVPGSLAELARAYNLLNEAGQKIAVERVIELTEIPKYQASLKE